jgi:UDP-N-acetylmuramoyl-tripeptide--D-alanyl-D-alanine ligase
VVTIIFLLIQIKVIQQILFNLYLWQLKEYRLDRFKEHINRVYPDKFLALSGLTLFSPIKLPQKSIKAFLIFILNLVLNYLLFLPKNILLALSSLFLTPFIFLFSLLLIYPFEKIVRLIIYHLASKKIADLQKNFGLIVIGITGSYGKSTTKSFIDQILSITFKTLSTPKSVNTPLGISLLILSSLNKNYQFLIVEMGAYKIGEIKELCQIVHPQIGIITGISNQHLALFGNQANIIKAKSELIEALPKKGLIIINKQSVHSPLMPEGRKLKIIYYKDSLKEQVTRVEGLPAARSFFTSTDGRETRDRIWSNDYGSKSYINQASIPDFLKISLEPALILAKVYSIDEQKIKNALKKIKLPPKTMQERKGYRGATIIDDSYNSNLEGTMAALDYLRKFNGKKIVVMPCLIELGSDSQIIHQKIGEELTKTVDLAIITTADYFEAIKKGAGKNQKIICLPDPKKTIEFLSPIVEKNSIILIEGKVHASVIKFLTKT